MSDLNAP